MGISDWLSGKTSEQKLNEQMLRAMQTGAEQGDPTAQYHLAIAFHNGSLIQRNDNRAFEWARRSALQGNPGAKLFLAQSLEAGWGCIQNHADAAARYMEIAKIPYNSPNSLIIDQAKTALGFLSATFRAPREYGHQVAEWLTESQDVPAQYCLARLYAYGFGVTKDETLGAKFFHRCLEYDYRNALELVSMLPGKDQGVFLEYSDHQKKRLDFSEIMQWLALAAERGVATAQYARGDIYFYGYRATPVDKKAAFHWYQKAGMQGHPEAQTQVGLMHAGGIGVPKDMRTAAQLFSQAAKQGNTAAQYYLGEMLIDGTGTQKDPLEGIKWNYLASLAGHEDAKQKKQHIEHVFPPEQISHAYALVRNWLQDRGDGLSLYLLGTIHGNGDHVPHNPDIALDFYFKAAEMGCLWAQYYMGLACQRDAQSSNDFADAALWFRKAAVQGHTNSQCRLAMCYAKGQGLPMDLVQAEHWLWIAHAKGSQEAKELLVAWQKI